MSKPIKIALICNNKMAYPALQQMAQEGVLCAIATADNEPEVVMIYSELASQLGLPYRKIDKKNYKDQLIDWLEAIKPDIVFLMTFPWRIPANILAMPPKGFLNFHYGLLPEMRGADPIFESIRNRKAEAGVTVHVMDEGLDTGPIVERISFPLPPDYSYGMLCQQMAFSGVDICKAVLHKLKSSEPLNTILQDEQNAKYWPKLRAEQITIKWDEMDVDEVKAMIRACNPIAKGAPVSLNGWKMGFCEISDVTIEGDASAIAPGSIVAIDFQNGLIVCCKGGKAIRIEAIYTEQGILPGYKLAMWGITPGMRFTSA